MSARPPHVHTEAVRMMSGATPVNVRSAGQDTTVIKLMTVCPTPVHTAPVLMMAGTKPVAVRTAGQDSNVIKTSTSARAALVGWEGPAWIMWTATAVSVLKMPQGRTVKLYLLQGNATNFRPQLQPTEKLLRPAVPRTATWRI
ncbi:uncharacterized protein LOC144883771 [Branchiostoma floridae x Branchiostoma japonicum]